VPEAHAELSVTVGVGPRGLAPGRPERLVHVGADGGVEPVGVPVGLGFGPATWDNFYSASSVYGQNPGDIGTLGYDIDQCEDTWFARNNAYCNLIGSYQLRPGPCATTGEFGFSTAEYACNKMDEIAGTAVASDAIYGWIFRRTVGNLSNQWSFMAKMEELRPESFVMNHDSAYNVLFTDGSVKTFSDSGKSLYKDYRGTLISLGLNYISDVSLADVLRFYNNYFDALDAQD